MVNTCCKVVTRLFPVIYYDRETVGMYTIFAVSILAHLQNLRFLSLFLTFSAFLYVPPIVTHASEFRFLYNFESMNFCPDKLTALTSEELTVL
jgi:hypothetical protein